LTETSERS